MDADDITQEVLIRMWQNIDCFNINKAKSWIMRTTHNLCIDYIRRQQSSAKKFIEMDEEFENNYNEGNEMNDTELAFRRETIKSKINEAVDKLPGHLKSVFVFYEFEGMKYKEISEVLSIPLNSVKVYLLRARKILQFELKELVNERTN